MFKPLHCKTIAFVMALLLPTAMLFSQSSPQELFPQPTPVQSDYSAAQGKIDGALDAKGQPLYLLGGAACGILGVIVAAKSRPKPSALLMQELLESKGEAYATGYESAYIQNAKNRNMIHAGVGLAFTSFALLVLCRHYMSTPWLIFPPIDDDYPR